MREVIEAELTWMGARFERGIRVAIDGDRIVACADTDEAPRLLRRRALLPGMISAHSHAFQRALRGRGERFPSGSGSFWTWREAMYSLVESLDEQGFLDACTRTFREMLAAGITSVGEFHYLHHSKAALEGDYDWTFDEIVLEAARSAGIRIVLLQAMYAAGGIGQEPSRPQRRFFCDDADVFWRRFDALSDSLSAGQSSGVVAHSVRAVPPELVVALHQESVRRGVAFHMHVEEQRQEIADSIAAWGATPTRLLLRNLDIGPEFTSVHATHTDTRDLAELLRRGANVCLAPLTEANLADGLPTAALLLGHSAQISLGTDSNARISMLEEMRLLEYGQRLRTEQRGVWRNRDGEVARSLFGFATLGGARSLRLDAGEIAPGRLADLITIDLDHPSLAGVDPVDLLDAWIFGCPDATVSEVCVGGRWVR